MRLLNVSLLVIIVCLFLSCSGGEKANTASENPTEYKSLKHYFDALKDVPEYFSGENEMLLIPGSEALELFPMNGDPEEEIRFFLLSRINTESVKAVIVRLETGGANGAYTDFLMVLDDSYKALNYVLLRDDYGSSIYFSRENSGEIWKENKLISLTTTTEPGVRSEITYMGWEVHAIDNGEISTSGRTSVDFSGYEEVSAFIGEMVDTPLSELGDLAVGAQAQAEAVKDQYFFIETETPGLEDIEAAMNDKFEKAIVIPGSVQQLAWTETKNAIFFAMITYDLDNDGEYYKISDGLYVLEPLGTPVDYELKEVKASKNSAYGRFDNIYYRETQAFESVEVLPNEDGPGTYMRIVFTQQYALGEQQLGTRTFVESVTTDEDGNYVATSTGDLLILKYPQNEISAKEGAAFLSSLGMDVFPEHTPTYPGPKNTFVYLLNEGDGAKADPCNLDPTWFIMDGPKGGYWVIGQNTGLKTHYWTVESDMKFKKDKITFEGRAWSFDENKYSPPGQEEKLKGYFTQLEEGGEWILNVEGKPFISGTNAIQLMADNPYGSKYCESAPGEVHPAALESFVKAVADTGPINETHFSGEGMFIEGMKGLVLYSGLKDAAVEWIERRDQTEYSMDYSELFYELGAFQVLANGLPLFTKGETDFEEINDEQYFHNYNPELITWATKNLIPHPNSNVGEARAIDLYEERFSDFFRMMVWSYQDLQKRGLQQEVEAYEANFEDPNFDAVYWLQDRYGDNEPAVARSRQGSMSGGIARGFWMRRTIDGTAHLFWEGLSTFMNQYDASWFQENVTSK